MNHLLHINIEKDVHRKYRQPQFFREQMLPELARQLAEQLLESGAIRVVELGPTTAADARDGYSRIKLEIAVINPLSNLAAHEKTTPQSEVA